MSYSFRGLLSSGKMDVFGYLESVKYRYGLDAADIWAGRHPFLGGGTYGTLANTDEDYLQKVKDALEERELVLADLCVDGAHLWEPDPEQREINHQNALTFLKVADYLGAKAMRFDAGGGREDDEWSDEAFDYIVSRYQEYAQRGYDNGYVVCTENHWGPVKYWSNLKKLYEAVDHPGFGVSCHVGGWAGEQADEADRLVAPWVTHTHLPWDITEGDLAGKLALLRDAGYDGYYSVEHHTGENEYTEVAVQIARVRDVLDRWRLAEG
jgi:sugar phosphate isomerase/epimerase